MSKDDSPVIPLDDDFNGAEYFPTLSDTYAEILGAAVGGRPRPAYVEQFVGIIRTSPCSTPSTSDYSDARYYVDRAIVQSDDDDGESADLPAQTDTLPGVRQCLTAVNLAELPFGTHLLSAGTVVQVFALYDRAVPPAKWYLFNQSPTEAVVVKVTGSATGNGEYNGRVLSGLSNASASLNLAMPAGMAIAGSDNALVLNVEEDGQTGHRLQSGSYATGAVVGTTSESTPRTIVAIRGGAGATASPTTIGGTSLGSESADTATWSRAANATPLNVYLISRVVYNAAGAKTLYSFVRQLSFDARGLLLSVSAETRISVDVTESCP